MLVAGTRGAIELLSDLLGDDAEVVSARSVREALERLGDGDYGTIACNVRFDESRMFEFLQGVRERPECQGIPIVAFRAGGARMSQSMRNAIRYGLEALGVDVFIDLPQFEAELGREQAHAMLRDTVLGGSGFSGVGRAGAPRRR